jgi:hypothetical protein
MNFTTLALFVFEQAIDDYHQWDNVDVEMNNPYPCRSIEHKLYLKNWIDTVQWHLEDIIRDPAIDPVKALEIKRRIDQSNQNRTDLVELIDDYFLNLYKDFPLKENASINTESPAWAIDRFSILALKIFHMQEEVNRNDTDQAHHDAVSTKLNILLEQREDLGRAIDHLLLDIESGKKYMKVYKQMKMYNDPSLNPVLYGKK